ncbi:MAG TPA: tRNA (uridine(34)/cytosine(34)/5-carboxymethylaminomethyluridine(34)-2'-O)-methyltransferase TrmL [Gammaproteobacteria bacterium]|nr:tRNA (uridine(34)/cytosine(34)/5-carboxymethylaminomethyluridine(34)-2'-O)-methyltransferase TrmL [Gammaproteobacteria bacterium]
MFHIALFEPEIPANTGSLIRLCANVGFQLHVIHPLGFQLGEKKLRRAGLDYHEYAQVVEHEDYTAFTTAQPGQRLFACTTRATRSYADVHYQPGDTLLFGPESRGLPADLLENLPDNQKIRIPMCTASRSINLANAVSIIAFEAWRQNGFTGGQ